MPEAWLRGVLAGVESLLGPWLVVIVAAIAVYVATAAAPELGDASWVDAVKVGTGVWLVAHGASLEVGDATLSIVPLGVSILAAVVSASAISRARMRTWSGVGVVLGTYVIGVAIMAHLINVPGAYRAVLGAFIVPLAAGIWVGRKYHLATPKPILESKQRINTLINRILDSRGEKLSWAANHIRQGWAIAWGATGRALGSVAVVGVVATILAIVLGWPVVATVYDRLDLDVVSALVLSFAQILLLPTLIIWASAYFAGPGFSVGEATLYSPAEVVSGPLPAIPILGALPDPEGSTHPSLGYVYILVGLGIGWFIHRRAKRQGSQPSLTTVIVAIALTVVVVGGISIVVASLAGGGFGPDRFAHHVGPQPFHVGMALAWKVGLGMTATGVVANPTTHRWFGAQWGRVKQLLTRKVT